MNLFKYLLVMLMAFLCSTSVIGQVNETLPSYPEGFDAFKEYLVSEFHYPESARKTKYQGILGLTLFINKDGSGTLRKLDFSKMKFVGDPKDEDKQLMVNVKEDIRFEVQRLIAEMPDWEPATRNGEKLRVIINVPMRLVLY
ncbi:hypothetical protein [Jiulongibacter sediminis]|uniref:TonB C-terminal domain-containing protein n=1 Tax=Jiulongibacter sediminis TaxID=1605367 RepID=A0A0P7C5Y8_9BACT|nr:hypothetical protein [Jiulongibacter sediminis]KPM48757.1 hypothetical protein AFM12_09255 [Jiulongibacter sediminis]TBX25291.1 hypothetical protein TK44_09260 [Jiulongibacter sediminis]